MRLTKFAPYDTNVSTFTFPKYDVLAHMGRAEARSNFQMTPSGGFDPHGNDDAVARPFDIVVDFEQIETTAVALQAKKDETLSIFRKRGKLYAEPYNTGAEANYLRVERWIDARCIQTPYDRLVENYHYQGFAYVFEVEKLPWHGLPRPIWQFDESYNESNLESYNVSFDSTWEWDGSGFTVPLIASPQQYQSGLANNNGNYPATDILFVVIAGGTDITRLEIEGNGGHLIFLDTISAGTALEINTENLTVVNNGVNAFTREAFQFGANHTIDDWFRMDPGENTITATFTGGVAEMLFNGDFEQGYTSELGNGWTKNGVIEVFHEDINVHQGSLAQSIFNANGAANSIQQDFTVESGDSLGLTLWANRIAGSGNLGVDFASATGNTFAVSGSGYQEYSLTINATTTSESIKLYASDSTTRFLLDSISVIRNGYSKFSAHFDDGWMG